MAIAESLDILRGYDDRIDCGPDALQIPIDAAHEFKSPAVPDDEQVDVIGNVEPIPGGGPEENYLLRLDRINDAPDYIVQSLLIDHWPGLRYERTLSRRCGLQFTRRDHSSQYAVGVFGVVVFGAHEVVGAVDGFGDGGDIGNVGVVGDGCHAVAEVEGYFDDPFQNVYLTGDVVCSAVSKCVGDGAG